MMGDKRFVYKQLMMVDYSPEKAGVGGSTPSLATIFSTTCEMSRFTVYTQPINCLSLYPARNGRTVHCRRRDSRRSCVNLGRGHMSRILLHRSEERRGGNEC